MAATNNLIGYGTAAQVACSQASLASGSSWESASTVNTSLKALEVLIQHTFTIATGAPSTNNPSVNYYAVGMQNATWPIIQLSSGAIKATGNNDASIGALGTPANLRLIGSFGLQTTTSSGERTFRTEPMSLSSGFAGVIPPSWSIVVENQTGLAFSSSTTTTANYLEILPIQTSSGN